MSRGNVLFHLSAALILLAMLPMPASAERLLPRNKLSVEEVTLGSGRVIQVWSPSISWIIWWELNRDRVIEDVINTRQARRGRAAPPAHRDEVAQALLEALASENPRLRAAAALALGRMREPEALPGLLELTGQEPQALRRAAWVAIGLVDTPSARAILRDAELEPSDQASWAAGVGMLSEVDEAILERLVGMMSGGETYQARRTALWALGALNPPGAREHVLDVLWQTRDVYMANEAIGALGRCAEEEDVELLIDLVLEDGEARSLPIVRHITALTSGRRRFGPATQWGAMLRSAAAIALGRQTDLPPDQAERARAALMTFQRELGDQRSIWLDPYGRPMIIALGKLGVDPELLLDVLDYPELERGRRIDAHVARQRQQHQRQRQEQELRGPGAPDRPRLVDIQRGERNQHGQDWVLVFDRPHEPFAADVTDSRGENQLFMDGNAQVSINVQQPRGLSRRGIIRGFDGPPKWKLQLHPERGFAALAAGLQLRSSRGGQPQEEDELLEWARRIGRGPATPDDLKNKLGQMLLDQDEPTDFRAACALALGLSDDRRMADWLLEALEIAEETGDELVTGYSLLALGLLRDHSLLEEARIWFGDGVETLDLPEILAHGLQSDLDIEGLLSSRAAVLGLAVLGNVEAAPILRGLWGWDPWLSLEVSRALAWCGAYDIAEPLMMLVQQEENAELSVLAAWCLGEMYDAERPSMLGWFVRDHNYMTARGINHTRRVSEHDWPLVPPPRPWFNAMANPFLFDLLLPSPNRWR